MIALLPESGPGSTPFENLGAHLRSDGADALGPIEGPPEAPLEIFHGYLGVFVIAFVVTLLATPVMRRLAIANGVIDHPSDPRKMHRIPVAYLGGVAVFLGIVAAVAFSYMAPTMLLQRHATDRVSLPVPASILAGMTIIMVLGMLDDVVGINPRLKIAGQLVAAAALAMTEVGTNVARGLLAPLGRLIGNADMVFLIPGVDWQFDLVYWTGVVIIAVFVLGACNASNLIDGLDGLLSGVTAIASAGLLMIALGMAAGDDGPLDGARVILCMALMGACLGFLPHNFNPASIFLGDAGSLLLGFMTIVIILTLGDTGDTSLVVAGLIIYSIPIVDTVLAIFRRKMAGRPVSAPDDEHLHHMLKRSLGVKGAVMTLYAVAAVFAALGVLVRYGRDRDAYTIALVFTAFIAVTAIKIARRKAIETDALNRIAAGQPVDGPAAPERDGAETTFEHEPARL